MTDPQLNAANPELGLVCMTIGPEVRFRTITLTRYRMLPEEERAPTLEALYRDNLGRLMNALTYCEARGIRLYRMSAALFPIGDLEDGVGAGVLASLAPELARVGESARALGVRVLIHPDQFIVLNSVSPQVAANSVQALMFHADVMDRMGFERSTWNTIILHGGKGGRPQELLDAILALPPQARTRLALENDERAFGPADLLPVCQAANVPLVFDAHHHVVHDRLADFDDPSVREWTLAARATWSPPEWQVVHLSNGVAGPGDRKHSDLISAFPSAYDDVPWIEVEAKGKEQAIEHLRAWRAGGAA